MHKASISMLTAMVWWLVLALLATLSCLTWVGWHFFLSDSRSSPKAFSPRLTELFRRSAVGWVTPVTIVAVTTVTAISYLESYHRLRVVSAHERTFGISGYSPFTVETLIPPPPLPPSSFVNEGNASLASADRDWTKLEPRFAQQVLELFVRMEQRGYPVALLEGYRSPERQDALANSDNIVTHARAFQSRHQYGLAVDLAPLRDGRLIISERDPWAWQAYQALGEEAETLDLTWGGRWSFRDYGHVEARAGATPSTRQ